MSSSLRDALRAGPLGTRRIPGSRLGPYEVVAELGRGGFGVVLRARRADGAQVALKVLLDAPDTGRTARARRFQREAELARALRHPGIVPVVDAGELDGLLYIAFELVEGATLDEALRGAPVERVVTATLEVARAVAHAHALGVVHRDLKPGNVLVRARDGQPLVTDFGLARDLDLASSLTKTGAALGTPAYMAPEQIAGKPADPAMDVFALGAILHELLTGELPFQGDNLALRFAAIQAGQLERASQRRPGVPAAIDEVLRRALDARPERRYPDAGALAAALEAAWRGEATGSPPRRGGVLVVAGGAGLGLALVVGSAWALAGPAPSTPALTSDAPPTAVASSPRPEPVDGSVAGPSSQEPLARAHELLRTLDPEGAATAARAALAGPDALDARRAGEVAWGLEDAARDALRRADEGAAPPDAATVRAAFGWLEVAGALDATRPAAPPELLALEDRLARRDDASFAVRWLVAARRRRLGLDYDRRALRLHEAKGPLSLHDERLTKNLAAAGEDLASLAEAYRAFTHATRRDGTPEVAYEAEEEMAARCLPSQRRSWCVTRGMTLADLQRRDEAGQLFDEAVALSDAAGDGAGIADARFWRAGFLVEARRFAEAEQDMRLVLQHHARIGEPPRNGWGWWTLAQALQGQGRHEEALAACAEVRRLGGVPRARIERLEEDARAALSR